MNKVSTDKQAYMNATPMQREVVRRLLCDVLGCLRAAYLSYQTSHWQVIGGSFYGNHLLFQRLYKSVEDQVDQLAEKLVGYLGREVVALDHQMRHIAGYTVAWSRIDCHHKRGLQSEADLQRALKRAYEGIKRVNAMSLGLDDWIMATANAHEENEYLLQQALTPVPGQKQAAGRKSSNGPQLRVGDTVRYSETFIRKTGLISDEPLHGKIVRFVERGWAAGYPMVQWEHKTKPTRHKPDHIVLVRRGRGASEAMTAEGVFYDNPEKKEVLEFADTGAISNSPEVAAAAAADGELDVSEAEAVAEADEAPPTPTEIKDEAGGSAVSTLNRFVVDSEDPDAAKAANINKLRMAAWLKELNHG